jgi:xanthine dehydrogenase accessory factor
MSTTSSSASKSSAAVSGPASALRGPWAQALALDWLDQGRRVVTATLVKTMGSAPLDAGAEMLFDDEGRIEGSVTGGCVEGALFEESRLILEGAPPHTVEYGVSDERAAGVGLLCGGNVRVFLNEAGESTRPAVEAARDAVAAGRPAAIATLLDGPGAGAKLAILGDGMAGSLGVSDLLDRNVEKDARGLLDQGRTTLRRYGTGGEMLGSELTVYIQAFSTPAQMIIFGAIDFSAAVAKLAGQLGYEVTICDARRPFVESSRFSDVAEVVVDWPDRHLAGRNLGERDVVLVFTHDSKFDEPALRSALESGAGFVGALGSRRTQDDRMQRLRESGVAEEDIARIAGPVGLDIGARTPGETAVSIIAEVIAHRAGRHVVGLSETSGPIHPRSDGDGGE